MQISVLLGFLTIIVLAGIGGYYAYLSNNGDELVLSPTWLGILAGVFIPLSFNTLVLTFEYTRNS